MARELAVPLVDYHAEILRRRPDDWDGASETFREYEGYDVPTLLSRDGVHPSAPERFQGDYSEEALRSHGYNLRNYLVLMAYAEVLEALAAPRPAGGPAAEVPHRPWYPQAPPLPPPAGEVIRVGGRRRAPRGGPAREAGRHDPAGRRRLPRDRTVVHRHRPRDPARRVGPTRRAWCSTAAARSASCSRSAPARA